MVSIRAFFVLGLSLIVGLAIFGAQIGRAVKRGREFDRYLTVRGLSEREAKATLAIWPIRFSVAAEDLAHLKSAMEDGRKLGHDGECGKVEQRQEAAPPLQRLDRQHGIDDQQRAHHSEIREFPEHH